MLYKTCPDCGANLDPGEKCDCKERSPHKEVCEPQQNYIQSISQNTGNVNRYFGGDKI